MMKSISINNIAPNLLIITTVSFALLRGKYEGGIIGFCCGFLQDIFFGKVLGFYALIYMYIGFSSGYLYRSFYKDSILIPTLVISGCDLIYGFYIYIFTFLLRGKLNLMYYLGNIIIPELVYTSLIAVIVYKLFHYINYKLEMHEKKEASSS
jgi:rod shape-determining protein MreD